MNHPNTDQPYTYPVFKIGDSVIDITAERNQWPDIKGKVIKIDGSNIKVKYESSNERWKIPINLRYA